MWHSVVAHLRPVAASSMSRPRLPWKRGRVAFELSCSAGDIIEQLIKGTRRFYSLRRAATLFGVSTQPLRDWLRLKHLRRDGSRGQFSREELIRFLRWIEQRAEPFASERLADRFTARTGRLPGPFTRLKRAQFLWPQGKPTLTPSELAGLIGVHPSLIIKAIRYHGSRLARRRSRKRWEIPRQRWRNTFFFSKISEPRLPSLPRQPAFTIRETASILSSWGKPNMSNYRVRQMIKNNELEGIPHPTGKRKWQVTRKCLEKVRKSLLTQ